MRKHYNPNISVSYQNFRQEKKKNIYRPVSLRNVDMKTHKGRKFTSINHNINNTEILFSDSRSVQNVKISEYTRIEQNKVE